MCKLVQSSVLLFTLWFTCLHLCTLLYTCVHMWLNVETSWHMCTLDCLCVHLWSLVYTCLNLCTIVHGHIWVHMGVHLFTLVDTGSHGGTLHFAFINTCSNYFTIVKTSWHLGTTLYTCVPFLHMCTQCFHIFTTVWRCLLMCTCASMLAYPSSWGHIQVYPCIHQCTLV